MNKYFADLHIHIGSDREGNPVKITASRRLHFARIAREAYHRKGLDMVGIIDCASPRVISDIEDLLVAGEMEELPQGGILYRELVIIPGAEVEARENNGGLVHYLAYFPTLELVKEFSAIMDQYITNINLSSQMSGLTGSDLLQIVDGLDGILIPAHAFTPHKSFYGRAFSGFQEGFSPQEWEKIPALELGLSADTFLADMLPELEDKSYLSNSDAHSPGKIAREYNIFRMEELNFVEFARVLRGEGGRGIVSNYGLDPRLGKYHRSFCPRCEESFEGEMPVLTCPLCESGKLVTGVRDRLLAIGDSENEGRDRPPYVYQVPLADIPGIGPKTLDKLLAAFGTEMEVIHDTDFSSLRKVVGENIADNIIRARSGEIEITPGGGGQYGKVVG
ncbi:MAG: endonuclease Q family protein [Halanaerobiaceae bacterium]